MLNLNTIYGMDCLEGMRLMDPESVDVIVTSPPYNIGVPYTTYDDTVPRDGYIAWIGDVAAETLSVLSGNGSLYLNLGGSLRDPWIPMDVADVFRKNGYVLQNMLHWIKSIALPKEDMGRYKKIQGNIAVGHYKPINSHRFHNDCHEFIFHFTKHGNVPIDRLATGVPYQDKSNVRRWGREKKDLRDRGNTWFIPYETIREERPHPATFPVQLPLMCIRDHGEGRCRLVMDPFMGIGSTALAAAALNLPYIGFEIDDDYRAVAEKRLSALQDI